MTEDHLTPNERAQVTDQLVLLVVRQLAIYDGSSTCSSSKLAEVLGVDDGATHPVLRAAIAEALRRGLAPICSTSTGYFTARDETQVRQYAEELEARSEAIVARAQNVRRAWNVRSGLEAERAQPERPMWVPDAEERE